MLKYLGLMTLIIGLDAYAKIPQIKIRIAKSQEKVQISGNDVTRKYWTNEQIKSYSGRKNFAFNCKLKEKINLKKPVRLATLNSQTGLLSLSHLKYRGKLHIITSERLDGCDVINEINLEEYISTLLPKEMSSSWPIEALKAQAVAARSYAHYKMKTKQVSKVKGFNTFYDLENSEKHQVNGSFLDVTPKTIKATKQTKGEVLTLLNEKNVPVFFHSKCGGKTRRPDQVWSNFVEGYTSVTCPFCHKHGTQNWETKIKKEKFQNYMQNFLKKPIKRMSFLRDKHESSQIKVYTDDNFNVIKKSRIRTFFGRKHVKSNRFTISEGNTYYKIEGAGFGHGVGLCQFGAKELALRGYNYKQILAYYFPEMKIKNLY